jgi:catechol 1,2-dioxygenase
MVRRVTDAVAIHEKGLNAPYAQITFDFVLNPEQIAAPSTVVRRQHAVAD